MDHTITVTSVEQFRELAKQYAKIAIDFKAVWCGPCKLISPAFKDLAKEQAEVVQADSTKKNDLAFLVVDVDEVSELAAEFGITAMPTFKFLVKGNEVDELIGASKPNLKAKVEALKAASVAAEEPEAKAAEEPETKAAEAN